MNEQVLVADDDHLIAADLKGRLEGLGYQVPITAATAAEAVSLAQSLRPDLVLMDVRFPGEMDGIDAGNRIHALKIPVVYLTGYCDSATLTRAKESVPYGYIMKPYDTADIKATVAIALHKAQRERDELQEQLKQAMAAANTLSGLLPICAYCKKIKDDVGEWEQIEAYIMRRSKASFTHGMCPDCFEAVKKQLAAVEAAGLEAGSLVLG